jgi:hypothetical protein
MQPSHRCSEVDLCVMPSEFQLCTVTSPCVVRVTCVVRICILTRSLQTCLLIGVGLVGCNDGVLADRSQWE